MEGENYVRFINPYPNENYYGYNPSSYSNPYLNQAMYPSQQLVYGPYQEGPSSQMIPPDWFKYYQSLYGYQHLHPLNSSTVSNVNPYISQY